MSRAVSIRSQLKKYMQRFNLPLESCEGDAKRLRRCLVSGYWRNGARWAADGTYRSVRGNVVRTCWLRIHSVCLMRHTFRCYMYIRPRYSSLGNHALDGLYSMKWRKPRRHSERILSIYTRSAFSLWNHRMRIITEIEPDWCEPWLTFLFAIPHYILSGCLSMESYIKTNIMSRMDSCCSRCISVLVSPILFLHLLVCLVIWCV